MDCLNSRLANLLPSKALQTSSLIAPPFPHLTTSAAPLDRSLYSIPDPLALLSVRFLLSPLRARLVVSLPRILDRLLSLSLSLSPPSHVSGCLCAQRTQRALNWHQRSLLFLRLGSYQYVCFLGIFVCSQSGDHPLKDVAKVAIIGRKT